MKAGWKELMIKNAKKFVQKDCETYANKECGGAKILASEVGKVEKNCTFAPLSEPFSHPLLTLAIPFQHSSQFTTYYRFGNPCIPIPTLYCHHL